MITNRGMGTLLRAIANNVSISKLTERGYSYTQIALLMEACTKAGMIEISEAGTILTPLGYARIQQLPSEGDDVRRWPLEPRPEHRVAGNEATALYVPPRRTVRRWRLD